jgi:hypothetical protein
VDANGANWSSLASWTDGGSPRVAGATANLTDAITAARTINLDVPVTLGTLIFDNTHAYTLAGAIPLTLDTRSGSALVSAASGSHTIGMNVALAKDTMVTVVQPAATLTLAGGVTGAGGLTLTKQGPGTLSAKNIRGGSNLTINDGIIRIPNDCTAAGVSVIEQLSIGGSSQFDLTNNKLVTKMALGTWNGAAYEGVSGMIQTGRNGGAWNGTGGIITSAATGNFTTLAVASAAEVKGITPADTAVWAGQTVTGSDTLVMFTYGGDANLDGKINVDDYGHIDSSVVLPGLSGWSNGDFNYDGKINVDDYGIIDSNVPIQGAPFFTGSAASVGPSGLSSIPEPCGLPALFGAAATIVAARRRRARKPLQQPA